MPAIAYRQARLNLGFFADRLAKERAVGIPGYFAVTLLLFPGAFAVPDVFAADAPTLLSKHCGAATMTIQCTPGSVDCSQTTLTIKTTGGESRTLEKPKGIGTYTAVGLACGSTHHGTYFVVQYGEHPRGCAFCEWYHLYTADGKVLTHSDPPVLTDTTLPPAQQQYPNNKEYNEIAKRLDLRELDMEFLH